MIADHRRGEASPRARTSVPPVVRGGRLAIVVLAILGWCAPAAAEWSAALPVFSACKPSTPPELPARWRAVGLMMPLLDGEIDVGEFVYDSTLPAMRASVYGLKSGAVDLLITKDDTYLIDGPHNSPRRCISLGRKLRPPEPQWLGRDARCVGEAPLADSQILSCPIKLQGRRVMWNWYTTGERPIMFTEAQPEGSGVMLADYHDWLPGQAVPPKNFDLPNACKATRSEAGASFSNPSCSDCHSTLW